MGIWSWVERWDDWKSLGLSGPRGFGVAFEVMLILPLFPPPSKPSFPGSEMASSRQALGSSPSCRVTWVGKLPTVSADSPPSPGLFPTRESGLSLTGECRASHPQ